MIPNPLVWYSAAAKWALPISLLAVVIYQFFGVYFSARVQQHWLQRLNGNDTSKEVSPRASVPRNSPISGITSRPKPYGFTRL